MNLPARAASLALLIAASGCRGHQAGKGLPPVPSAPPSPPAPAGPVRLHGRILFQGEPPPSMPRSVPYDQDVCGGEARVDHSLEVDPTTGGVRWAVITLSRLTAPPAGEALPDTARVDQARCDYLPYLTLVRPGARITFTNADPILHAVRAIDSAGHSRVLSLPPGSSGEVILDGEDRWKLVCDLHPWSQAWVITSRAEFAAVSDEKGEYSFHEVPPGRWRLDVWEERLVEASREVEVPAEGAAVLDLTLAPRPVSAPGKAPPPPT